MQLLNELVSALRISVRVALSGRFWGAIGKSLLSPGLLCVMALLLAMVVMVDVSSLLAAGLVASTIGLGIAGLFCLVMAVPLFMRAWSPIAARAVAEAMDRELPETTAPSLGRFVGAWLLVVVLGVLILVPAFFIPRPFHWIMLLPAAVLFSSYQVRCALCIHAGPDDIRAVLSNTLGRRTLLWFALCSLPFYLYGKALSYIKGLLVSPYELGTSTTSKVIDVAGFALDMGLWVIVLVLWAALSLQVFATLAAPAGRRSNAARPAPPAVPAPVRKRPAVTVQMSKGKLIWAGVLLVVLGGAYLSRMTLLHHYLLQADRGYQPDIEYAHTVLSPEGYLRQGIISAACANKLSRIKLIMGAGVRPTKADWSSGLFCSAEKGHIDMALFMLDQGGDVNATYPWVSGYDGVSPLQRAVSNGNMPMVKLLLSRNADPSLQTNDPAVIGAMSPLQWAAKKRNVEMIRVLVEAGARTDVALPKPAIFYFVQDITRPPDDWKVAIAAVTGAGLSLSGNDATGGNLLHWAAAHGQFGLIDELLARGMDWRQQDKGAAQPFMYLAARYSMIAGEPGPELEAALTRLTEGLTDINARANLHGDQNAWHQESASWTLARAAARKQRIRSLFGERVNYAAMGGPRPEDKWPLYDREHAAFLVADLSALQIASAANLPGALREKGWADLALLAERKR